MVKPAETYCPDYGDVVWIDFDPQRGREQGGRRPAIVLTDRAYSQKSNLMVACPITSKIKGYPFEVLIHAPMNSPGVILVDQIKTFDWVDRKPKYIGAAPMEVIVRLRASLTALLRLK